MHQRVASCQLYSSVSSAVFLDPWETNRRGRRGTQGLVCG